METTIYDRLQQAGERAETIAALMRAALRTWDREDTPVDRLLALVEQAHEDASFIISALLQTYTALGGENREAEQAEDEGCPKDDPECLSPADAVHDACEPPTKVVRMEAIDRNLEEYADDVDRIVRLLAQRGWEVSREGAALAWMSHADEHAAGWLVRESDESTVRAVLRHLRPAKGGE